jgi:hypothetical protein
MGSVSRRWNRFKLNALYASILGAGYASMR